MLTAWIAEQFRIGRWGMVCWQMDNGWMAYEPFTSWGRFIATVQADYTGEAPDDLAAYRTLFKQILARFPMIYIVYVQTVEGASLRIVSLPELLQYRRAIKASRIDAQS